jgi:AcrR family transcriptional regulator
MHPRQPVTGRELRSDAYRNRERVLAAAVAALHRDGPAVPMARIAADAGVGVGTVYRHFPAREDLLAELTYRSFRLMLSRIEHASETAGTATDALRIFITAVIADRNEMVLRSTGGPEVQTARSQATQDQLHDAIRGLIARGSQDGTIKRNVEVWDIAWLGATLAQPGREGPVWDAICVRLLDTYLAGLGVQ